MAPERPQDKHAAHQGRFPAQPMQINFGLIFQPVGNRWRLFGISVNPTVPKAPTAAVAPPQAPGGAPSAPKEPTVSPDVKRKSP